MKIIAELMRWSWEFNRSSMAVAIILNKSIDKKLLKDSKIIKIKKRALSKYIKNSVWSVGKASVKEIEKTHP